MKNDLFKMFPALVFLTMAQISGNAFSMESYTPSISFQKTIISYIVRQDGSYTEVNEASVKIETQEGVSKEGEVNIPFNPKFEDVVIEAAYTILSDGSHVKVPKGNFRLTDDELNMGGSSYSDTKHMVIIYPALAVGCQTYYKYKRVVRIPYFANRFQESDYVSPHFQYKQYEVNFSFDPKINLQFDSKGFLGRRLPDRSGMQRYSYSFRQETALPPEQDEIEYEDFAPFVIASNFSSYVAFGDEYEKKAKSKVRVTAPIQKLADELTAGVQDKRKQAHILYDWVAKNIRYVASYVGNGGYVPHDSQTILDNKWGDCKDHVVLLGALLGAKGIDSSPALINAEKSYVLPKLTSDVFNHVITFIPSIDMYLDSTDQLAPFGTLPDSDLDKQVILTRFHEMGKTPTMRENSEIAEVFMNLKLMPDGSIQGTSNTRYSGTIELFNRHIRFSTRGKPQDQITNAILSTYKLTGTGQLNSSDPTDLDTPYTEEASFTLDPISRIPGPGASVIPGGLTLGIINQVMFSKPKDKLNFLQYCESLHFINDYEIEFPPSFKIRYIPENVDYKNRVVTYTATYTLHDNTLRVHREVISHNLSMVCGESENKLDKEFFPIFMRDMMSQVIYD